MKSRIIQQYSLNTPVFNKVLGSQSSRRNKVRSIIQRVHTEIEIFEIGANQPDSPIKAPWNSRDGRASVAGRFDSKIAAQLQLFASRTPVEASVAARRRTKRCPRFLRGRRKRNEGRKDGAHGRSRRGRRRRQARDALRSPFKGLSAAHAGISPRTTRFHNIRISITEK